MKYAILVILVLSASFCSAQDYSIDWYVIGSGGGHAESATYQLDGTIGQSVVGYTASTSYQVEAGFWVGASFSGPQGYEYIPGDANMAAGGWEPIVIGADVTYLVNYFRGISTPCIIGDFYCSADANGDCLVIGSDVTFLVNYFRGLNPLNYCADYEPAWPPLPGAAPAGWPNCVVPMVAGKADNTVETVKAD